ncbi:hypothetical protein [Listeria ivanovii]|uniref:Uncharacterized protein n=2 Tax=Listeria ivanovii TaxID=1638 RepID=A0ABS1G2V8_LISIV|nr:hypothetical protein [Listeria ivanovii]EFR97926.1 conserved hypothetical protein [Listeria ivanovii FSL F6-596]AIS59011.1 hypothetical protein JL58_03005 [Listeria ivanovii subsp. londoniensis]AIS61815.1 hypothetical protein JL53_03325 [Listeria ivanovii subsp. londoniensis]MBK1961130.1 hypothetical protein [Listeria ivanovii subsp. londoniensis]MBK1967634.1 hypothetical protein [Listeria ivanovii subsp. londoniensis]
MRFILAYLSIFVLGIFSALLIETILYENVTPQLVFSAILFAAPVILIASTLGEIFYGFSKKANYLTFSLWGFAYGVVVTVIILSIIQVSGMVTSISISILGGIIMAILAIIFFFLRGGNRASGKAATK